MVKINNDLVSTDIEVRPDKCGKLNIVVEGPCPANCTNCKSKRVQDPRVYAGAGAPLGKNAFPDVDKVIGETVKLLRMKEQYDRQNAKPSLQELFDEERARKKEPAAAPQKKPSPTETLKESKSILRVQESLQNNENQQDRERLEEQRKESEKLIRMIKGSSR